MRDGSGNHIGKFQSQIYVHEKIHNGRRDLGKLNGALMYGVDEQLSIFGIL